MHAFYITGAWYSEDMQTTEEWIVVVAARLHGQTFEVMEMFHRKYGREAPTRGNIRKLVNKFVCTRSVLDEKRTGRPSMSAETVANIHEAIDHSPAASTRCLSRELVIPQSSVWKVLHYILQKKAYHVQVLHKPKPEDYAAWKAVCYDLCQTAEQDGLMDNCSVMKRHSKPVELWTIITVVSGPLNTRMLL